MMKTVSVPDVAECAHAAEVAAPVKDDWPAEGGNVAACPQTPTDSPRRTLAERGPLPADALALLNGIDLKNSVQKDVEKPEAQKLLAVAQHIDTLVTLFNDDSTMWPSNEDGAMVLFDFCEINPNNIQHHLVRDVTEAMREGCVEDLLSALNEATRRSRTRHTCWAVVGFSAQAHERKDHRTSNKRAEKVELRCPKRRFREHRSDDGR